MTSSLTTEPGQNLGVRPVTQALIGGQLVDGRAGTFDVTSPQNGSLIGVVAQCDATDVDDAVRAARAAQPTWAAQPLIERVKTLRRVHALFAERAEPVAMMLVREIGKTLEEAREEVHEYAAPSWQKAGEEVLRHRGLSFPSTQEQTNNKRLVQSFRPLGVVGVITPYNFPTDIASIALAHIVAAGNTVVWKPSEYSAISCAMVGDIVTEAGLPAGVINIVHGFGDVGAAVRGARRCRRRIFHRLHRDRQEDCGGGGAASASARARWRRSVHRPCRRRHRRGS